MNDYKKIADLLFPNLKYTPQDLEKIYPPRNLPQGAEVTRIAPSPTGYFHIGGMMGALIDYNVAKTTGGVFYLRLEDTDSQREVKDAGLIAARVINHFGLKYQEGLLPNGEQVGNYGPYVQSQRAEIYKTFAKKLVEEGKAFPCFCEKARDKKEILMRREKQLQEQNTIVEHDVCRNLTLKEIEENLKQGKPFAIRLKSTGKQNNKIQVYDQIKGQCELGENTKDAVLLKSNGIPPYAFAHAVDDHLMRTTTVIRGEEWFPSLPLHLQIFEALGFEKVKYAHTPVICKLTENGNKRKISKRYDPEADMRYYLQEGYPVEAVIEYLLTLANTNFEEWRIQNPYEDISKFPFTLAKVSSSNPIFDIAKFNHISKNVIAKFTAEQVYDYVLEWASQYDKQFYELLKNNKQLAINVFSIDRGGEKPRKDIAKWNEVKEYFYYMFYDPANLIKQNYNLTKATYDEMLQIAKSYAQNFNDNATKEEWFTWVKELAQSFNYCADNKLYKQNPDNYKGNVADFCTVIRYAFTGRENSPDLYSICKTLGSKVLQQRVLSLYNN